MSVIIGHTRFSLFHPNFEGWKASNGSFFKTPDEYKEFLFADSRLEPRVKIFLTHTLPILAGAEKNSIYKHIISFSSNLPDKYKSILKEASQKYECIVLDEQATPEDALNIDEFARQFVDEDGVFGVFRVDDDDILSSRFFLQAEEYLKPAFAGMKVTFGLGCTAIFENGSIRMPRMNYQPMIAIGLLSIKRWNANGTLVSPHVTAHNRSDRYDPVILSSKEPTYLWLRHVGQDTNVGNSGWSESVEPIEKMMKKLDRVPNNINLGSLFPTIEVIGEEPITFGNQIEEPEKLANPLKFIFPRPLKEISISLSGLFDKKPVGDKNFILSFELQREDGSNLPIDFEVPALTHSEHPLIDWYVYLNETEIKVDYKRTFILPDGIYCSAVTIMRWHESEKIFTANAIDIQSN